MSTETLEARMGALETALPSGCPISDGTDALAARLAVIERAYAELLQRVRGYERERAEIRHRLERILTQITRPAAHRG